MTCTTLNPTTSQEHQASDSTLIAFSAALPNHNTTTQLTDMKLTKCLELINVPVVNARLVEGVMRIKPNSARQHLLKQLGEK